MRHVVRACLYLFEWLNDDDHRAYCNTHTHHYVGGTRQNVNVHSFVIVKHWNFDICCDLCFICVRGAERSTERAFDSNFILHKQTMCDIVVATGRSPERANQAKSENTEASFSSSSFFLTLYTSLKMNDKIPVRMIWLHCWNN